MSGNGETHTISTGIAVSTLDDPADSQVLKTSKIFHPQVSICITAFYLSVTIFLNMNVI